MSEEEKEAIEWLKHEIEVNKFTFYKEKLLNLIEKQQEEIEEYKKYIDLNEESEIALNNYIRNLENEVKRLKEKHKADMEFNEANEIELNKHCRNIENKIRELKSENYELNNRINDLLDSIPKSKIEDKIKVLKKIYEQSDEETQVEFYEIQENIIDTLQELLEGE